MREAMVRRLKDPRAQVLFFFFNTFLTRFRFFRLLDVFLYLEFLFITAFIFLSEVASVFHSGLFACIPPLLSRYSVCGGHKVDGG
jgi:hypothetical protein